jgi:hypothetical protein
LTKGANGLGKEADGFGTIAIGWGKGSNCLGTGEIGF